MTHGRAHGDERPRGEQMTSVHEVGGRVSSARARRVPDSAATAEVPREHLESSPLAIAVVEGGTHILRYVNPAFRQLSGTDAETVLGCPVGHPLSRLGAERIHALLQHVETTGAASSDAEIELEVGGKPAWWTITAWPVPDRHGGHGHLMMQLRDVTGDVLERQRRVELVAQMQAVNERLLLAALREEELTRRAQAANEAKSIFLATMSHELRTPLTAIIGYGELLADGITGRVSDEQRVQLGRIRVSALHLLGLIDEVLRLAHIAAHRETVRTEPIDVGRLFGEVRVLVAPLAAGKSLTWRIEPPPQPVALESDPVKVRQVLVNLLSNAIRFTDRGEVSLSVRQEPEWVLFQVRDTGIGIRPEHLERIFDEFWQVEQRPTRRVGGSGLGLAITRRLARMMGGDVTVTSAYQQGSTFTLSLPARHHGITGGAGAPEAPGDPAPPDAA